MKAHKLLSVSTALAAIILSAGVATADVGGSNTPPPGTDHSWVIMAGSSLKSTLEGWCKVAGWTLIWDSPVDYRVRASATFDGDFQKAAAQLIDSVYESNPELNAVFHRGNNVLHISDQPLASN